MEKKLIKLKVDGKKLFHIYKLKKSPMKFIKSLQPFLDLSEKKPVRIDTDFTIFCFCDFPSLAFNVETLETMKNKEDEKEKRLWKINIVEGFLRADVQVAREFEIFFLMMMVFMRKIQIEIARGGVGCWWIQISIYKIAFVKAGLGTRRNNGRWKNDFQKPNNVECRESGR